MRASPRVTKPKMIAATTVMRSRFRSIMVEPAAEAPRPPPNMSDRPPPRPLCSSTSSTTDSVVSTCNTIPKMNTPSGYHLSKHPRRSRSAARPKRRQAEAPSRSASRSTEQIGKPQHRSTAAKSRSGVDAQFHNCAKKGTLVAGNPPPPEAAGRRLAPNCANVPNGNLAGHRGENRKPKQVDIQSRQNGNPVVIMAN